MSDVFISYCHKDYDYPNAWVGGLHQRLTAAINAKRPNLQPQIFFDRVDLRRTENFDDRIQQELKATQVLLCVSSRAYSGSRFCGEELDYFVRQKRSSLPSLINVQKEPVDTLNQREPLQAMLGYKFHDAGSDSPFLPNDPEFDRAVGQVAGEIVRMLDARSAPRRRVMVLSSGDREQERQRLANDLIFQNLDVWPSDTANLPGRDRARRDAIREWARQADFAILLLGRDHSADVELAFDSLSARFTALQAATPELPTLCLIALAAEGVEPGAEQAALAARINDAGDAFDFIRKPEDILPETQACLKSLAEEARRLPTLFLYYLERLRHQADIVRGQIKPLCSPDPGPLAVRLLDPFGHGHSTPLRTETEARDTGISESHGALIVTDQAGGLLHNMLSDFETRIPREYVGVYCTRAEVEVQGSLVKTYPFLLPAGSARPRWLPDEVTPTDLSVFLDRLRKRARK